MRKLLIPIGLAAFLLLVAFGALRVARGQSATGSVGVINSETQEGNTREILAPEGIAPESISPDQPLISFIDSPTVACVQPDASKNECYINWYYMSVNADPSYIISMTVKLNEIGFMSRYSGFFQTSMYVPFNMNPQGYKVVCGAPGSGGDPAWGKAYAYTIRARDSAGLASANYGTAYCPPYTP